MDADISSLSVDHSKLSPAAEDELQNFLQRAEEISSIVKGMASRDPHEAEKATRRADLVLSHKEGDFSEEGCKVKLNKSGINRKAFEAGPSKPGGPDQMDPEAFMAHFEKDARERARDKKERKEISDMHKRIANDAFRVRNYEKALYRYDLAIEQIKDSGVLYTNRALTLLHLGIYSRAASDCEWALKVNEDSLKAWLYKAKAHHCMGETEESERCLQEAETRHPELKEFIEEFKSLWDPVVDAQDGGGNANQT